MEYLSANALSVVQKEDSLKRLMEEIFTIIDKGIKNFSEFRKKDLINIKNILIEFKNKNKCKEEKDGTNN